MKGDGVGAGATDKTGTRIDRWNVIRIEILGNYQNYGSTAIHRWFQAAVAKYVVILYRGTLIHRQYLYVPRYYGNNF